MNSISPRTLRTIITVGLLVVLIGIIGAYIYIGMYYAKMGDQVADTPEETTQPVTKRDQVLEALANATSSDPAKQAKVLESLNEASKNSSTDPDKRQKILDALTGNATQNPE